MADIPLHAAAVTKSDTIVLDHVTIGVWVGGTGDLTVTMLGGEQVTFSAVPAGSWLPIRIKQVWSTGTSATNIVALWGI